MVDYYLKYLKYKSKYLNLKGGEPIDSGVHGIVFRPPLRCSGDVDEKFYNEDYIGKCVTKEEADKEFANSNIIKGLDPTGEWSITIDKLCEIDESGKSKLIDEIKKSKLSDENKKKVWQLISKFGGITLNKGIMGHDDEDATTFKIENLPLYFKLVKRLIPIIEKLNETDYFHNDLHLNNVLYNKEKDKLYLFDFGETSKFPRNISDFNDVWWSFNDVINRFKDCKDDDPNPLKIKYRNIYKEFSSKMKNVLDMEDLNTTTDDENYKILISNLPDLD